MRMLATIALLSIFASALPAASSKPSPTLPTNHIMRQAEYRSMSCSNSKDPEPRDTPNPVLNTDGYIKIDFIISYNGHVYSPLVLEATGSREDVRSAMRTVSSWSYHPSTCNGVPSDAEATVLIHQ